MTRLEQNFQSCGKTFTNCLWPLGTVREVFTATEAQNSSWYFTIWLYRLQKYPPIYICTKPNFYHNNLYPTGCEVHIHFCENHVSQLKFSFFILKHWISHVGIDQCRIYDDLGHFVFLLLDRCQWMSQPEVSLQFSGISWFARGHCPTKSQDFARVFLCVCSVCVCLCGVCVVCVCVCVCVARGGGLFIQGGHPTHWHNYFFTPITFVFDELQVNYCVGILHCDPNKHLLKCNKHHNRN